MRGRERFPCEFECESRKNRITRRSTMIEPVARHLDRSIVERKASLQAANMYFPAVVWKALRTKMRNSQRRTRLRVACVNDTCVINAVRILVLHLALVWQISLPRVEFQCFISFFFYFGIIYVYHSTLSSKILN